VQALFDCGERGRPRFDRHAEAEALEQAAAPDRRQVHLAP
jgi:hypothetical protein